MFRLIFGKISKKKAQDFADLIVISIGYIGLICAFIVGIVISERYLDKHIVERQNLANHK